MKGWNRPSGLEREADAIHDDPFVALVDAAGRVAGRRGAPRNVAPLHDDDIFIAMHQGRPFWMRAARTLEDESFGWNQVAPEWAQPLAVALSVAHWNLLDPRCEVCGGATVPSERSVRRVCTSCGALVFVRTDPAIIVAVLDPSDRILLARQPHWEPGRRSVLAGFVEPGESLEQACWREVWEEARVTLSQVSYVGSQPWPMPRSLMTGFVASTDDELVVVDHDELEAGDFYTREQVREQQDDGSLKLPSSASLGRALIERWLADQLPRPVVSEALPSRHESGPPPR